MDAFTGFHTLVAIGFWISCVDDISKSIYLEIFMLFDKTLTISINSIHFLWKHSFVLVILACCGDLGNSVKESVPVGLYSFFLFKQLTYSSSSGSNPYDISKKVIRIQ